MDFVCTWLSLLKILHGHTGHEYIGGSIGHPTMTCSHLCIDIRRIDSDLNYMVFGINGQLDMGPLNLFP